MAVFPWAGRRMVTAELWRQVKTHVRPGTQLRVVEFSEPSLVWEFRQGITNYAERLKPQDVSAALHSAPPFCVVLPTRLLAKGSAEVPSDATVLRAQGLDTAGFRYWDLTAVIKQ